VQLLSVVHPTVLVHGDIVTVAEVGVVLLSTHALTVAPGFILIVVGLPPQGV
jgi:archaellum component FlaG (FlaF/FlaG flagellin family)